MRKLEEKKKNWVKAIEPHRNSVFIHCHSLSLSLSPTHTSNSKCIYTNTPTNTSILVWFFIVSFEINFNSLVSPSNSHFLMHMSIVSMENFTSFGVEIWRIRRLFYLFCFISVHLLVSIHYLSLCYRWVWVLDWLISTGVWLVVLRTNFLSVVEIRGQILVQVLLRVLYVIISSNQMILLKIMVYWFC